jgi:ribosomal protein L23
MTKQQKQNTMETFKITKETTKEEIANAAYEMITTRVDVEKVANYVNMYKSSIGTKAYHTATLAKGQLFMKLHNGELTISKY